MMREVLTRRFSRLAAESEPDAEDEATGMPDWPDVVFIDGGQGQLNAVREVIAELNLPREVTFIGIAKGEERDAGREKFFMEGREAFMLPHRDPVLYYVQRLRDEAHRFAIGTHRAKRKKDIDQEPARRDRGHRPDPQARPARSISARPRPSAAPASPTSPPSPAFPAPWRSWSTTTSTAAIERA